MRTERREHVDHILYEIVLHLGLVDDNELAPARREGRLDVLRTKTGEPIAMLWSGVGCNTPTAVVFCHLSSEGAGGMPVRRIFGNSDAARGCVAMAKMPRKE
jgi:hypothetical protein